MALKKLKTKGFEFKPFSKKQLKVLTFWAENSPVKDKDIIIADGAIRSGKTIILTLSFILYVMSHFEQMDAGMCGKTIGAFKRNVLSPLKQMLVSLGYEIQENISLSYIEVYKGSVVNKFWIFGGRSIFATYDGNII